LAHLIFKTKNKHWDFSDLNKISTLKIIDPACGSGTLLSASYTALKDRYILSRPASLDLRALHKLCMEDVLHGWDILDYAAHLTLTTLALHNYRAAFSKENIYVLPIGVGIKGVVRLGSLDYLSQQILMAKTLHPIIRKGLEEQREEEIEPPQCDIVIMNPPFTRSAKPNVKFGYTEAQVKTAMNRALAKLTQDLGMEGIGQAGLGAYFMLLADKLLKVHGRVGVVIPRAILSGVSWGKVRKFLERDYTIEYIISNYDPGDADHGVEPWNWSENTNLGEVLIIARKVPQANLRNWKTDKETIESEDSVTYVGFWKKPRNEVESLLLSQQTVHGRQKLSKTIKDGEWASLTLNGTHVGAFYQFPQKLLKRNWLFPCLFANPELNRLVVQLLDGGLPTINLSTLVSALGIDIKQVKTHFSKTNAHTLYKLLWGQQASMSTMFLDSGQLGFGKAKQGAKSAELHKQHQSSLLISERPHLNNDCVLALETQDPVLATAFWEIQLTQKEYRPLVLLWVNSTLGFLHYLSISTNSMGEIFKTKKEQLSRLPIVDPHRIDLHKCARLYETHKESKFFAFPKEFALATQGKGLKKILDDFFIKSLRLDLDLTPYYEMLAKEPILTLKRL